MPELDPVRSQTCRHSNDNGNRDDNYWALSSKLIAELHITLQSVHMLLLIIDLACQKLLLSLCSVCLCLFENLFFSLHLALKCTITKARELFFLSKNEHCTNHTLLVEALFSGVLRLLLEKSVSSPCLAFNQHECKIIVHGSTNESTRKPFFILLERSDNSCGSCLDI